jgi:hypothetical protein
MGTSEMGAEVAGAREAAIGNDVPFVALFSVAPLVAIAPTASNPIAAPAPTIQRVRTRPLRAGLESMATVAVVLAATFFVGASRPGSVSSPTSAASSRIAA